MIKNGKPAPDFTLKNQDEKDISISDYKGKWVILYFYPKDNTSGCTREAVEFTEAEADFSGLNAEIIGVSPDSCKSHRNFIAKHELGFTLLSDPEKDVLENYGVWQEKKMYGRTYMGVVRSTFLINPEGNIAESWTKVKVNGHVEAVKKKLEELL